jgi:uncharacterized membrane protein
LEHNKRWIILLAAITAGSAGAMFTLVGQFRNSWLSYVFSIIGGILTVVALQLMIENARQGRR